MTDDEGDLPVAHEAFARHFTDPLYDDEGEDLAPFGSDEGWELLVDWGERRASLDGSSTLATILECEPSEVASCFGPMEGIDGIETARFIVSAAFVLLRLTGQIPEADRELALRALAFDIEVLPRINAAITETPAELLTQQRDLAAWRNP